MQQDIQSLREALSPATYMRAAAHAVDVRSSRERRTARNPPGLLSVKLTEMEQGRVLSASRSTNLCLYLWVGNAGTKLRINLGPPQLHYLPILALIGRLFSESRVVAIGASAAILRPYKPRATPNRKAEKNTSVVLVQAPTSETVRLGGPSLPLSIDAGKAGDELDISCGSLCSQAGAVSRDMRRFSTRSMPSSAAQRCCAEGPGVIADIYKS